MNNINKNNVKYFTFSNHNFYPRFINKTSVDFSSEIIIKEFKFNVPIVNRRKNFEISGAECDIICNIVARMNDLDLQRSIFNKNILANEIKQMHVNLKKK